MIEAMNYELKLRWATLHGKTVEQLTSEDMADLNDALFQAWLKYKGITEEEL